MGAAGVPVPLCGRGDGIPRCEWFSGQRLARAQVSGLVDPTIGFAAGDAQSVGQHTGEFAADFSRGGLAVDLADQRMTRHRQPAHLAFQELEVGESVRGGQSVVGVPDDARDDLTQRDEVRRQPSRPFEHMFEFYVDPPTRTATLITLKLKWHK